MTELATGLLSGLAYGGAGLILLLAGYKLTDALTPGRLTELIYENRNVNASLVTSSSMVAVATIVTTAILTSADDFSEGIGNTFGYGLLGILLLGISFVVVDKVTPGKLGVICTDEARHPAVYVTVATQLALGAIVAAAIS